MSAFLQFTAVIALSLTAQAAEMTRWATEEQAAALMADMRAFFEGSEVRFPGCKGNLAMEQKVARIFADTGLEHGEIRFEVPAFVPGTTVLTVEGQDPIRLLPMHPTLIRPGNFKQDDFSSKLVYLGKGTQEDLLRVNGVPLDGAIALMEFTCGSRWMRLLRFGVRGFIFIEPERYFHADAVGKIYGTEVSVPRFLIRRTDGNKLRDAVRDSMDAVEISVSAEPSRWKNGWARDLWVLIPGRDETLEREVVVVTAPLDSNCVVPELATGAQAGANLYLLMRLLETFHESAPARSVLLAAVNARTQGYRGERMLAWHLLMPSEYIEVLRNQFVTDIRLEELYVDTYSTGRLRLDGTREDKDEKYLRDLRRLTDDSIGKIVTLKNPIVNLARRDVNQIKAEQLKLAQLDLAETERDSRRSALQARRTNHVNVLTLFNKVGVVNTLSKLAEPERDILRGYVRQVREENHAFAVLNRRDLEISKANDAIKQTLAGRRVAFMLSLELDWLTRDIGFSTGHTWGREKWAVPFGKKTTALAEKMRGVRDGRKQALLRDTLTLVGGVTEGHYFPVLEQFAPMNVRFFQAAHETPAFAMLNVNTKPGRSFTPADTMQSLDALNVAESFAYLPQLLRAALDDETITTPSELPKPKASRGVGAFRSIRVKAHKFDEFSAAVVPNLPVAESIVIMKDRGPGIIAGDVINRYFAWTDERASCVFYGVRNVRGSDMLLASAYHFDSDFRTVDHAVDAGEAHVSVSSNVKHSEREKVLALFRCEEHNIYAREDPSMVSAAEISPVEYLLLDARRNSAPRKYGFTGFREKFSGKMEFAEVAPGAVFVEPESRFKLLTSLKRLGLNSDETDPKGAGYGAVQGLDSDFFRAAATDMAHLNRHRLAAMRGVSDRLAERFIAQGEDQLERMRDAAGGADHFAYLRALYAALGAQVKAYRRISAVTNDMLKAVVFYMALMLPFCFFLQKLLFKPMKIEAQMGIFMLFFIATYVIFRQIHPAFRIAQAPEAMFVAFVMAALGLFVIGILHRRFEGEMQLLFQAHTAAEAADVGYSAVGQQAMLIGVTNMKRRRIRTALTAGTIVLITFTILAFTSISKSLSPTVITKKAFTPYTGIMYHWPSAVMDKGSLEVFRDLFAGDADIVVRRWLLAPSRDSGGQQQTLMPYHAGSPGSERSVKIEAILGLPVADDGFVQKMPLIGDSRFFSSDDADEAVIAASVADVLNITPDNLTDATITFWQHEFRVVGIVRDEEFRAIQDINARPILPIKTALKESLKMSDPAADTGIDTGDAAAAGIEYVDPSALIILPVDTCARLGGAAFSVSVRLKDDQPIWPVLSRLLTITYAKFTIASMVPFHLGDKDRPSRKPGVYYVGSGYRTSFGGLARLIVPVLIASTLIMNTMLGSVFERKQEIAIYNAVGLNPTHIGIFFLAEAFVYGIIGAVGGYLLGQLSSIALSKTGIVADVNLNFSSLSVVFVILFTIAIVLLSTLYPSIVATRAAVPSGKRTWSLPPHTGDRMEVPLPFIYQPDVLVGAMRYLEEYFERFTQASVGEMIAQRVHKARQDDEAGRECYLLQYNVALAPFDLGVTQKVHLQAGYDEDLQAHRIVMTIERVSGEDSNWATTNRPFLEKLRGHLIHWRNLTAEEHSEYVRQGKQSFRA